MHDVMPSVYVWLIQFDVAFDDFFVVSLSVVKSSELLVVSFIGRKIVKDKDLYSKKKTLTQTKSPGTFPWSGCSRLGKRDAAAAARTQHMLRDRRMYKTRQANKSVHG
jgi:hypothetical protein